MNNNDEQFLQRWSRRKREAKEQAKGNVRVPDAPESVADTKSTEPAARPKTGSETSAGKQLPLTEADFADVDFDALDFRSDYSRFLAPGVPETIKNKALRKLWASDPMFTAVDELQDYAGDFTDAAVAVAPGALKTAYRVGRGFMSDEEVAEWEKLGKPENDKDATASADPKPPVKEVSSGLAGTPILPPVISLEHPDHPEAQALLQQSDRYHAELYPAESNHLLDRAQLAQPNVRFLLARLEGVALACGALLEGQDGQAEIKRMFVAPAARRRQLGRQILLALEREADVLGVRVIRLETGVRQPEALALYRSHGYIERGPFGTYRPDPLSTFFEKWIG